MKRTFYIFIYLFIILFVSACNIEINTPIDSNKVDEFTQYYYYEMNKVWINDEKIVAKSLETDATLIHFLEGAELTSSELEEVNHIIKDDIIPLNEEIQHILNNIEIKIDDVVFYHQVTIEYYELQYDTLTKIIDATNSSYNQDLIEEIISNINKMAELREVISEGYKTLEEKYIVD